MAYAFIHLADLAPVVKAQPGHMHPICVKLSPTVHAGFTVDEAMALARDLQMAAGALQKLAEPDPILRGNADLVSEHGSLGKAA